MYFEVCWAWQFKSKWCNLFFMILFCSVLFCFGVLVLDFVFHTFLILKKKTICFGFPSVTHECIQERSPTCANNLAVVTDLLAWVIFLNTDALNIMISLSMLILLDSEATLSCFYQTIWNRLILLKLLWWSHQCQELFLPIAIPI